MERGSIYIDEAGFCNENSIVAIEPYSTQDTSFKSSTDEDFDNRTLPVNAPMQRIYFSSASDKTSYFYKKYVAFAKRMIAGDRRYFVADVPIDVPLAPTINGKQCAPLLSKSVYDQAMATNPRKALREYKNKFDEDGGDLQIIKGSTIENNSTFYLPEIIPTDEPNVKYGLFYDSAHVADNSVILVGKFIHDEKRGWYGKVVNLVNFKDINAKFTNRQMTYDEQRDELRKLIVKYNGNGAEYENIHTVEIDSGSGGGGILYAHSMMHDYVDNLGDSHRGIIDKDFFEDKVRDYPNAYPILRMIEPSKWKNTMVKRTIDLMDLGLIEFPKTYNNSGSMDIDSEDENGNIITVRKRLSKEEELALINIDLCKEETKMIHRYKTASDRIVYKTRVDVNMHDDRFYVLIMFGNAIHELRHDEDEKRHKKKKKKDKTILGLFN